MPQDPRTPTADELRTLPRWARVAFAARCARRVQPIFVSMWPDAPEEHVAAVQRAISFAEHSAAFGADDDDAITSILDAIDVGHAARAADAARAAARAAVYAGRAAFGARAADAARAAARAADAAPPRVLGPFIRAVRADVDLLREAAARENWTAKTPVPPEFFGPLWPDGEPEGWPPRPQQGSTEKHSLASQSRLVIRAEIGGFTPEEEAAEQLARLVRALNAYHIAAGGSGLVIDDWQMLSRQPEEVLA